ncbi:MAG: helix-turn-helix transcriptional regulator [Catenulispora sp.]|nr:helix-turn-helix transcriptional regulator [Catenulispora sp.]
MPADRIPPHPDPRDIPLQQVLEALIEPARRAIIEQLSAHPADIACGAFDLTITKSTATHHFRVLREAGLIRQYYAGTSRMNSLRREEFDDAFPGLLEAVLRASLREAGPRGMRS